ncbi:uncharacterized protein LOC119732790 [Patiria miniata]|uniref:Uncharacterized protein n=1 Tax=Patiria miniata TaxID=46514 RepID=A0A914AEZ6_PATMI|nr:uncharacterized protein LOC119732790 [Patiria miniata]
MVATTTNSYSHDELLSLKPTAAIFCDLIDSANLEQHVTGPTHREGHTLDLILSSSADDTVSRVVTTNYLPSDHAAVKCLLNVSRPDPVKRDIKLREIRKIDIDAFRKDILASPLYTAPASDLNQLVHQYESTLKDLLNQHAPLISRNISCRPHAPWYNEHIHKAKQELRKRERKWKSSKLAVHKQLLNEQIYRYNRMITQAKTEYHRTQLADCDSQQLFRKVDKLCTPKSSRTLPPENEPESLVDRFSQFFSNKTQTIIAELDNASTVETTVPVADSCETSFTGFDILSDSSVRKMITGSPSTTCRLDPIPTSLLKKCLNELTPIITTIINLSLENGHFPDAFKSAHVTPLLKKPNMDPEPLKNYRPIANLKFLAKITEQDYLLKNSLHSNMQSAYKRRHSVETALLRVNNDL